MAFQLKDWFFKISATATKRGTRFKNGDRPTEATFKNLVDSSTFKSDPNDRAKEDGSSQVLAEMAGHVVAATDTQAKANQGKLLDRTLVTQPSQLPSTSTSDKLTISSPNVGYNDTPLSVSTSDTVTTRNEFLVNLRSTFTTWLQSLVTFVDNFKLEFDAHVLDYNITKGQVTQNTADIAALSPGGSPAVVPVGAVMQWMADVSVPATFHVLEGGELEQASNPLLFAILGAKYNDGSETPGYFRLPDMRDKVARGTSTTLGDTVGSDSVILTPNNLPAHNHDSSGLSIPEGGAHNHTIRIDVTHSPSGSLNKIDVGDYDDFNTGTLLKPGDENGSHTHTITGNTGYNTTTNAPVSIIPRAMLVKFIIKGD